MGSQSKPPVPSVGEYPQWRRRMIQFLKNKDKNLMKFIRKGPNEPYITILGTPTIPERTIQKPHEYYNETEKARAEIDYQALTL